MRVHEETKVHLLTYAAQTGLKPVKPFVLVIARDTTHAAQLLARIESDTFFGGNYKGKVLQTTLDSEMEESLKKSLGDDTPIN